MKKLKSPKTSLGLTLSKTQIDCALDFLTDWVCECLFFELGAPEVPSFLKSSWVARDFSERVHKW